MWNKQQWEDDGTGGADGEVEGVVEEKRARLFNATVCMYYMFVNVTKRLPKCWTQRWESEKERPKQPFTKRPGMWESSKTNVMTERIKLCILVEIAFSACIEFTKLIACRQMLCRIIFSHSVWTVWTQALAHTWPKGHLYTCSFTFYQKEHSIDRDLWNLSAPNKTSSSRSLLLPRARSLAWTLIRP